MNLDFIVEGLDNFANWGGAIADIFTGLGDLFGSDGLPALSEALGNGDDAENGDTAAEGSSLIELSSGLSSNDATDGATGDADQE